MVKIQIASLFPNKPNNITLNLNKVLTSNLDLNVRLVQLNNFYNWKNTNI